ncbi:hypothetical protein BTVI_39456 [Pitangus sulphuratus]|nr:hypothetical protein BTVI_39456 [Pitangus sulphuratus]
MGGNTATKDEEKAEILNTFFASVFNRKTGCPQGNWLPELVDRDRKLNSPPVIEEETVSDLLSHLDPHRSMGPDGIHPRVMRELAEELSKPLFVIYQQSWLTEEVPDDWKLANVTPVYKKGCKEDLGNSRPDISDTTRSSLRSIKKDCRALRAVVRVSGVQVVFHQSSWSKEGGLKGTVESGK